jgi:hypothetical protein
MFYADHVNLVRVHVNIIKNTDAAVVFLMFWKQRQRRITHVCLVTRLQIKT